VHILARLKGFQKLTPIEESLRLFLDAAHVKKPNSVVIPLDSALNRILAENVIAKEDLPRCDRSAVDGYAVRAKDTIGASQFKPRTLQISEKKLVGKGQAVQVWTGNPIAEGANAVVMLEDIKKTESKIDIWTTVTPYENVSRRGEDVSKGQIAVTAGTRLKPHHLGLIAALGFAKVAVFEKPRIGILATGNELVNVDNKRSESQIFNANTHILSALTEELGAKPVNLGIVKDSAHDIQDKVKLELEKIDAILTSGGTSVGGSDLVPEVIDKIGKPGIIVHGVAMRPGMPTALAVVERKPIIILPGNPVAAMVGFEVFARPLICRMLGLKEEELRPIVTAKTTKKIATSLGRKTFVRVLVSERNGEYLAQPISARGSGVISTMTQANGYVIVPENREGLAEEELVSVHLFDNIKAVSKNV
jgi:molybdopterin molybdotransferase